MLSYQELINYLLSQDKYQYSIKPLYTVIHLPTYPDYHITIYQDQWDDYKLNTGKPYHLFHISSNDEQNRCSSYFWVGTNTNKIQKIPRKYFKYNQPIYDYFSSTRSPCELKKVIPLLKILQKIINEAARKKID